MRQILLKELNTSDLDWLFAVGSHRSVSAHTVLWQAYQSLDDFYLLLEGQVSELLGQVDDSYSSTGRELNRLSPGDLSGIIPGVMSQTAVMAARTMTDCTLLAIDRSILAEKMTEDLGFAAHLYRASARLLAHQLQTLSDHMGIDPALLNQPQLREGLTVFAELQDSDLDWLIAVGQVQPLAAHQVLMRSGYPIDAFHVLLDGSVALSLPMTTEPETEDRSISRTGAFLPWQGLSGQFLSSQALSGHPETAEAEIARLSRGEMLGEMGLLDADLPMVTVRALRDSQVLSIPRWRLAAKLLHDVGFASRFYRVLTILLAHKRQSLIQQYRQMLDGERVHATDLGGQFLTQVALAEARFEWLLNRLQTQQGAGREMQW
ncbi:MAG: cyclic nucleotide-binding domain-containing protein [Elainella sp. Prado103]|nr:cyclic nucleotide-binding domain-containing protein [Elainella sp. Prado103]